MRSTLLLSCVIAIGAMVSPAPAHAQSDNINVFGSCPSKQLISAALLRERTSRRAGYRVLVTTTSTGARLRVTGPNLPMGGVVRSIKSDDCAAIADAFALIIASHVRAAALPPPTANRASSLRPAPAKRRVRSSVSAQPEVHSRVASGLRRHSPQLTIAMGLSAGVDTALSPTGNVSYVELDVMALRTKYGLRVTAGAEGTMRQDLNDSMTLFRSQRSGSIQAVRFASRGAVWYGATAGLGLVESFVTTSAGTLKRLHPTVISALLVSGRVTSGLSIRAELSGHLYPVADTYIGEFGQFLGNAPQATLRFGAGMVIDF